MKELRELASKATPGPWCVIDRKVVTQDSTRRICGAPVYLRGQHFQSGINADCIAAASPDVILALLDKLDRQEKLLREAMEYAQFCWRDVPMNDYAEEKTDALIAAIEQELK